MGPSTPSSKSLNVGILIRVATTNPREAPDGLSSSVAAQVYETPYRPPLGDGPAEPVLFDGPLTQETSGGETIQSGRLRPGITFSDGTPLTVEHVAASLRDAPSLAEQAHVEVKGERIQFRMKVPNARFELALTLPHCGVTLEKGGQLLGTGPYTIPPGATSETMRLERNPRYHGKVAIEEIRFSVLPAEEDGRPLKLIRALEAGTVDFTTMLSRKDALEIQGLHKSFKPAAATAILFFNTERPALRDARVRKALALAIDRLAVAGVSYPNPLAFAATSLLPSILGMSHDGLTHDLAKARALLGETGVVKPGRLRMLVLWAPRPYLPNPRPVAKLIAEQLALLGIAVDQEQPGSGDEFFAAAGAGRHELVLGGWIADTPDPADYLEAILRSDRLKIGAMSYNVARFRSAAMDAALDSFRRDPSAANRNAIMGLLNSEVPLLPLMYGPNVVVHANRVRNVAVSPLGVPYFEKYDIAG